MVDLVLGERQVDRHQNHTDLGAPEQALEIAVSVRKPHGNPIAVAGPGRDQAVRNPVHTSVQRREVEPRLGVGQGSVAPAYTGVVEDERSDPETADRTGVGGGQRSPQGTKAPTFEAS